MTTMETAATPQELEASMAALAERIRALRWERRDREVNVLRIHGALAGTGADLSPLDAAQAAFTEADRQLTEAIEAYIAVQKALPEAITAAAAARRSTASPVGFMPKKPTTIARRVLRDHQAKLRDLEAKAQSASARRLTLQSEIMEARREAHHAAVQTYMAGHTSIAPAQSIDIGALEAELRSVTADAAALQDALQLERQLTEWKQQAADAEAQEEARAAAFTLFTEMLPAARRLLEQNRRLEELAQASQSTDVAQPFHGPFLDQWLAQADYFGGF
jgi:hypothetical protein